MPRGGWAGLCKAQGRVHSAVLESSPGLETGSLVLASCLRRQSWASPFSSLSPSLLFVWGRGHSDSQSFQLRHPRVRWLSCQTSDHISMVFQGWYQFCNPWHHCPHTISIQVLKLWSLLSILLIVEGAWSGFPVWFLQSHSYLDRVAPGRTRILASNAQPF